MKFAATPLAPVVPFASGTEVVAVNYAFGKLKVRLRELGGDHVAIVRFSDAQGYRVMNERDLPEYWPTCLKPNGWLFEILDGGWLFQESARAGSLTGSLQQVREFLIAGEDDCVSVLSVEGPNIEIQ